ncbi:MAG TPA: hypothetical protein VMT52_01905, partial [Planctomycetota bacterium]|nr:hypothetical protein [Planctomycetota bacterium]
DWSGHPDLPPNGDAAADALAALIQLGSPMAEARRLRDTAWARLLQTGESVQAIDADRLLREALRMG